MSLRNDHGSCGYHASGEFLCRNDTFEVVAIFPTHMDAVRAMLAIPPYEEPSHEPTAPAD